MIQFKRKLYGLSKLHYDYKDISPYSRDIFRIINLNQTFNVGKNEFRLLVNKKVLLKNSKIYIDIIDANGDPIYYEISPIANKDNSRSIIVYIYHDTAPGSCTLQIASRLFKDPRDGSDIFHNENIKDEPNVLWTGNINVSPYEESVSKISFLDAPVISYKERIEQVQVTSGSTRLTNYYSSGSNSLSIVSNVQSKQFSADSLDIERSIRNRQPIQSIISSNSGSSDSIELPVYDKLSIIKSNNGVFSSSMAGGMLYINNINLSYPSEVTNTSSFLNLSYSTSIVNVIDDKTIEVQPPFNKIINYTTSEGSAKTFSAKSFFNHNIYTASYYDVYNLTSSLVTQSFLEINAYGIEPVSGLVDSIDISYKPVNAFGDFTTIGEFDIDNKNLLVDSGSIVFDSTLGIIERSIGKFPNGLTTFQRYWQSGSVGDTTYTIYGNESTDILPIVDGMFIKAGVVPSDKNYIILKPLPDYSVYGYKDTEFEISFLSNFAKPTVPGYYAAQVDIYISGSVTLKSINDITNDVRYNPIKSNSLGKYIGSITSKDGISQSYKLPFITEKSGEMIPIFVVRSGWWSFGKVELKPRKELGFGPNQSKLFIPLTDVIRESELNFRIQYQDKYGIRSDEESVLYGLYFQGSSPLQYDDLSNIPDNLGSDLKLAESFKKVYITQSSVTVTVGSPIVQVSFPIFLDDNSNPYTGSTSNVGMGIEVNTVIFGRTGSAVVPINTYTWAGTIQNRAIVSSFDNSGKPLLFNPVAVSGSSHFGLGTFGSGPVSKPNLDSWFVYNTMLVTGTNSEYLSVRYHITPTSSFGWDVTACATCTVYKHEFYQFA